MVRARNNAVTRLRCGGASVNASVCRRVSSVRLDVPRPRAVPVSGPPDAAMVRVTAGVSIPVAVVIHAVTRIVMTLIGVPVVRVTGVTIMMRIQSVGQPAENIRRGHAPEKSRSERVIGGVGIIIDRTR